MKINMKLSIITINYNNAYGLQKTLESVINQTYKNFEYIIIDGGSVDGSKEIIEKYSNKFAYWVSEKDNGIYNAMNKGIKQAKGEYCLFLNSGDWLVDECVLEKVFLLNVHEDILYGNLLTMDSFCDKGPERSLLTLTDLFFGTINHPSSFIKRILFQKYGLYNEEYKIVSDWEFFFKVICLARVSVRYLDIDISYFDMTGVSNENKALRNLERNIVLKKELPKKLYEEYLQIAENRNKARVFDKIAKQKTLWFLIRAYNKIFASSLW